MCHGWPDFRNSLRWRQNGRDSVSNHQPRECLFNHLFRRRSKKTSKPRVTGLCMGNSPGPVNSPHKGPVTRKMFPFDDAIMCFYYSWTNYRGFTIQRNTLLMDESHASTSWSHDWVVINRYIPFMLLFMRCIDLKLYLKVGPIRVHFLRLYLHISHRLYLIVRKTILQVKINKLMWNSLTSHERQRVSNSYMLTRLIRATTKEKHSSSLLDLCEWNISVGQKSKGLFDTYLQPTRCN